MSCLYALCVVIFYTTEQQKINRNVSDFCMRNMVIYYMEALLKHITSQVNDGADYVKESSGKDQEPPAAIQNSEYRFVRDLVTLLIEKALTAKEKATNGGYFDIRNAHDLLRHTVFGAEPGGCFRYSSWRTWDQRF
ncbi:hypothetical protein MBAV_004019 [Candidatus Magnetobacterium bavaricum]|uniref:Uncharacterized protein n=1 Tax=Candidatus Magnetobacterium bavaricum TaxID=29290 RepID=A0A0F3GPI3_9BACT|nr:hypothetical protein MBAV_004019 [Candidatus Magnetobacterium bavaricum]